MLALLLATTIPAPQAALAGPGPAPLDRYRDCVRAEVRRLAANSDTPEANAKAAVGRCTPLRDPAVTAMVAQSLADQRLKGGMTAAGRTPADLRVAWGAALDDGMLKVAAEGVRRLRAGMPLEGATATGTYSGAGKIGEPLQASR